MSTSLYKSMKLPSQPSNADLLSIVPDYEAMLITVMAALADRYDPTYPFINTKLNLITGRDFLPDDPIRGRDTIYGWIQGRGLEALAGHCQWMKQRQLGSDLLPRLEEMMQAILASLREMRAQNAGHLTFFMTPQGEPFCLNESGLPQTFTPAPDAPYGFSDLFSAKGMYAAACYLNDRASKDDALNYCLQVDHAIWSKQFQNDQISLDPKNPVPKTPGHHPHGPFMIQIGTATLLVEQDEQQGVQMGLRLIQHEMDHYINVDGKIPNLKTWDLWEAVNNKGQPFCEQDIIISDPGHALECVGLALKFTATLKKRPALAKTYTSKIQEIEHVMSHVLIQNFENGFLHTPGGICKVFDLVSRKPLNTDLPWWNLPETMRAAAYCLKIAKNAQMQDRCRSIFRDCHNAFVQNYVRSDLHLMAYQTLSKAGEPIDVIPATADADPGYHTGLSMIDVLDLLSNKI